MKHTIHDNREDATDDGDDFVSKSQRKRDMHRLQDLGKQLTELTRAQLNKMALPEDLLDAILAAQSIHSNSARKRQLQYIGKLMRSVDPEPLLRQLEDLKNQSTAAKKNFHKLETLRDRLLEQGDQALSELLQQYPDADRQHLRQLLRSAQKEKAANKTPRAARALFRYLRELTGLD